VVRLTSSDLTVVALAVLLGGTLGVGLRLVLVVIPRWGAPSLVSRIAPYVRDVADPLGLTPLGSPARPTELIWEISVRRVGAMLGGAESVARRLRQAGRPVDVVRFRSRQLAWTLLGLLAGGLATVALALSGGFVPQASALPVVCALSGGALCDLLLTRSARRRMARIAEELPTVLEFLALCLAAGEGILDALRRVGSVGSGELTVELRGAVLAVRTGSSLSEALDQMGRGVELPALTRTVDHLVAALDRGAPLADVLKSQAVDSRDEAKRALLEQAGRKEILMLLPLVFLILPLSVLFAVFPGVFILRLGVG
jgi:tight adherence protein C